MYCYHCMKSINDTDEHCIYCGAPTSVTPVAHHLKPGTVLNQKYLIGAAIGEGGFGITYIGLDLVLQRRIAVKEYFPKGCANRDSSVTNRVTLTVSGEDSYFQNGKERFLREAQSIAKFSDDEGIVDVRDYFTENETAYIVMEYLDGKTMAQHLKEHGRMDARRIFRLLLPAMRTLQKMHTLGVIHRDISPDNIMMMENGQVKLMDFGSARYYIASEQHTMSVTLKPGYAPYEQYSAKGDQGPWTDVYGLCATLYKCITGVTPEDPTIRCQADTLKKPSQLGIPISPRLESALMYGLAVFPKNRCHDMKELIRLVEAALKQEDDPQQTVVADVMPATPPVRRAPEPPRPSYGDTGYYSGYRSAPPRSDAAPQAPAKPRRSYTGMAVFSVVLLLLVLIGFALFMVFRDRIMPVDHDTAETTAEATAAAADPEEAETSPAVSTVTLPDVSGKKLSDASAELEALGLVVETTEEESADVAEGYVLRQSIAPGRQVNPGDTVMLYVAKAVTPAPTDAPVPATSAPVVVSDDNDVLYNTLCKEFVTLRSSPSMKADEVTKIPKYAAVDFLNYAADKEFCYVRYNGKTGYALSAFFTKESTAQGRYVMYCVARQYANLRSKPGSDNDYNIDTIPTDSPVQCTGVNAYVDDQEYLQVIYKGQTGYVLADVFSSTMDGSTYKGD